MNACFCLGADSEQSQIGDSDELNSKLFFQ